MLVIWRFCAQQSASKLTVILGTFCAADYVFERIAIFNFYSEQYVFEGSLWINLYIGDFSQSVCHCN